MLSEEATSTDVIVIGLFGPGLEPTIYPTRSEHLCHNNTDAIKIMLKHKIKSYKST